MNIDIDFVVSDLLASLPQIIALAVEKRVEVALTISPENVEIRTSPWAPLQYVCPVNHEAQL